MMADRSHPAAYTNQWLDYLELLYEHELAPNSGLRPFAPFRLYKIPVAPPCHKTKAEVEYTVEQQALGERQLRLYATKPPPRASGADPAEPASMVALDVARRIWLWLMSSAWTAWARALWSTEPLWHTGRKRIETTVAWVCNTANTAAARMRGAWESSAAVISVCAILLALVIIAEGLLRLVSCYVHPGDGMAQEPPHYVPVQDIQSWAIPQPPNCPCRLGTGAQAIWTGGLDEERRAAHSVTDIKSSRTEERQRTKEGYMNANSLRTVAAW